MGDDFPADAGRAGADRMSGLRDVLAEVQTGRGVHGVVAAAAPIAAAVGAEALRAGGNAYDAVVTAALAETVLLPPKCGLGGDLVALRFRPGADAPDALLAIGGGPAGLADAASDGLPDTGPLSVGVPAAPAGYAELARLATRDRAALAAPARRLARDGFCWSTICTRLAEESVDLVRTHHPGGTRYLPGGSPIPPGAITRLPGLDRALGEWVERGERFLDGPVGAAIVRRVRDAGGVLAPSDLAFGVAEWCAPAAIALAGGGRAWATPAPTHGPYLLESLPELARARDAGAVWDAVQAAIARRRERLADPRPAGTSMVSAADADGNVVVVVHSNSYPRFGSGLVVDGYDLILNNRAGRGFTATSGHPNAPAPGRRPATTLHAWALAGPDLAATLLGATPGGANQLPWNAQLLWQVLRGESHLGRLVTGPRWEWLVAGDGVRIEAGFEAVDVQQLRDRSGRVEEVAALGLRCAQQVVERPRAGHPLVGAVDPRTDGAVVAV